MIKNLFICTLAVAHVGAVALDTTPPAERKFHFVVPTEHPTHVPNRASPFKLEFRNASFDRMRELLAECKKEQILPDFTKRPTELVIYLSQEHVYRAERDRLSAEAHRQFEEVFPGAELKIKFRVIKTKINHTYVYKEAKRQIEKMKEFAGTNPAELEKVREIERVTDEAYEQTRNKFETSADTGRRVKASFAISRAFIIAGTRAVQTMPAMMHGGVPLASSLGLIVADFTAEYFLVVKSQKMQRFFSKTFVNTSSAKVNAFASNATNMAWNLTLFSVSRPMIMQVIQHIAQPMAVDLPSWSTVGGILQWSLPGALVFTIFNKGYNKLRDKGWLSASQIDVALQGPGVLDSINAVVNSNPDWYWLRPFINLPQMGFYALVGLWGSLASRKSDRILAVDSSIATWEDDIHPEQLSDASFWVEKDEDFGRALTVLKGPGLGANTCGDMILKNNPPLPPIDEVIDPPAEPAEAEPTAAKTEPSPAA